MKKHIILLLLLLGFIYPIKAQYFKNEGAKITIGSTSFVRSGEWSNLNATSQTNLFGNLSLTQNLINNGIFLGQTGSSLFFIGTTLQNVQGTNPFSLYNMQINNAGNNVSLSNSITISNLLTLTNGRLISETAPIFFSATALNPVETNANRIIGTATMQNRAIGTGNLATFLGASFATGADLGNVSLTRKTGTQGIITNGTFTGIAAHWSFTSDNNAARNLSFSWLSDLDNGKNLTQMQLWRSTTTTAAGQWTSVNASTDMSARSYSYASNSLQTHWSFSDVANPLSSTTAPEINVVGNGVDIPSGSTATITANNTDLGQTVESSISKTFIIQNTGASVLNVSSITSSNAAFTVSNAPSSVAASGQATFTIVFTPTTSEVQISTITINSNDADEAAYTFNVSGKSNCPTTPDVSVSTPSILPNQVGSIRVESQLGVNYQLQNASTTANVGNLVNGTGGIIYLQTTPLSTTTTFRVIALRTTLCGNQTSNTVTVTVSPPNGYGYGQTQINDCASTTHVADIDVSLSGSSYSWSNGTSNQNLTDVANGVYNLTIDGTTTLPVIVGTPVVWENPVRGIITNEGRLKANGTYNWDSNEAAATSKSKLESNENGGFTFLVEDMATIANSSIGFATPNTDASYLSIDNSFYIESDGKLSIYLNDIPFFFEVPNVTVSVGDRLTITREGTSINYYYNSSLVYTDTEPKNATDELVVDIALVAGTSPQVWFSTCTTNSFEVNYVQSSDDACNTSSTGEGAITLLPQLGGVAPYTYSWSNGIPSVGNPTGLITGLTSVTVTDNIGFTKSLPVIVGSPVNWTDLQNVSSSQGKLFTIGFVSNYSNSGAISQSGMGAATNGGITYTYKDDNGSNYIIGLSSQNTNPDWTTILYSTYIKNGRMQIYESGVTVKNVEGIADQDRISIIRMGNEVVFYQNSKEVHRMACITGDLFADATVETGQTPIIYASWCSTTATDLELAYTQTSTDNCTTSTGEGAIDLRATGGSAAYVFTWNDTNTSNPRTALKAGLYTVTLRSGAATLTAPVIVGSLVNWGNLTANATQTTGSITATTATDFDTPEGGLSVDILPSNTDGGVSFIVPSGSDLSNFQIGLSSITSTGADWQSMGYSVWINSVNSVIVYESGVDRGAVGSVAAGDRISIIRKGSNIEYYINSKLVREFTTGTITQELAADVSVVEGTSPVVYASWCAPKSEDLGLTYTQTAIDDCATFGTNEGAVTLQGTGGAAYTYTWNDANTDNPRTGLARGLYNVTLASGAASKVFPVVVGGFVNWGNLSASATQSNGTITSSVTTDFEANPQGGLSTNRLAASTDGGITYIVPASGLSNYQIGLSSTTATTPAWRNMEYSIWINGTNNITIYESGTVVGTFQTVATGDRISIVRKAGNVEYYVNDKQIRITTTGTVTQELAADIVVVDGTSPVVYASFCNPGARIANKTKITKTENETVLEEDRFAIYPNPSTGIFNVRFASLLTENTEVTIFDGIGRAIKTQTFEKGNQKFSIDLNNQPKGMYLIHFNQNGAYLFKINNFRIN